MSIAKLYSEFFRGQISVKIDRDIEGQACDDQVFRLGVRCGPNRYDFSAILHEMCHFVELERERLLDFPGSYWGFGFGKYWQIGTSYGYEPQTDRSVQREIRTWAYQLNLSRYLGFATTATELTRSAVYLPAFPIYSHKVTGNYYHTEAKSLSILAETVAELSNLPQYSVDELKNEWFDRLRSIDQLKLRCRNNQDCN